MFAFIGNAQDRQIYRHRHGSPGRRRGVLGSNYWTVGTRYLFEVMECSKIVVVVIQLYEYIKNH